MAITFVDFKNEYFDDFRDMILPNIYDEIISSRVMEEDGFFMTGALDDDKPVGAAVGRLSSDRELDIASIFVAPDYRRRHIGSTLIDYLLSEALNLIEESSPIEDPNISIMLNAEYSLPEKDSLIFRSFLESKDFTMHTDYEKLLFLEPEDINAMDLFFCGNAEKMPENEELLDFDSLLSSSGIQIDESLCFYTGKEDDPSAVLLAGFGFESIFLISQKFKDTDREDIKALLFKAISEIHLKYQNESLIVNMEYNLEDFYDLLQGSALVCTHCQSMSPVAFPAKEAQS